MNIAVFVSGNGSNLQALIEAQKKGDLDNGRITLVVSDRPGVLALKRAEEAGIKTFILEPGAYGTREAYDREISRELEKQKTGLIVLAGFMRMLSAYFVKKYEGRILNIHPSLLPAFKGAHAIKDAFSQRVKITGVTVHFVTEELDAGPIVLQTEVHVNESDTLDILEGKIHAEEHRLYPEAVRLFVHGKLRIEGDRVRIVK